MTAGIREFLGPHRTQRDVKRKDAWSWRGSLSLSPHFCRQQQQARSSYETLPRRQVLESCVLCCHIALSLGSSARGRGQQRSSWLHAPGVTFGSWWLPILLRLALFTRGFRAPGSPLLWVVAMGSVPGAPSTWTMMGKLKECCGQCLVLSFDR